MIALLLALYARALDTAEHFLDTLALLWSLMNEPERFYCDEVVETGTVCG